MLLSTKDDLTCYRLEFELARTDGTEAPTAVRHVRQTYILRSARGIGSAELTWDAELAADLAELQRPAPDPGRVQRLGDRLRLFLERGLSSLEGWGHHEQAIRQTVERGGRIHVVFHLAAAELLMLPWQLVTLRTTAQHLGELSECLIQYTWCGNGTAPALLGPPRPGRLLFGWSTAGGLVPAGPHLQALSPLRDHGCFEPDRDVLPNLSTESLRNALASAADSGAPYTALHILCHGAQEGEGTYSLLWNDADRRSAAQRVSGTDLRRVLDPFRDSLRLVVLCACNTADGGSPWSAAVSVAQSLHRLGIPCVVGSRLPFSPANSVRFAQAFYGALVEEPFSIRHAMDRAKARLAVEPGLSWASLQLHARPGDEELQLLAPGTPATGAVVATEASVPAPAPAMGPEGGTRLPPSAVVRHLGLAFAAGLLLMVGARVLGSLVHDAREELIGIPPALLTYGEPEVWRQGLLAVANLVSRTLFDVWAGSGVERWGVGAAALLGITWVLLARSKWRRLELATLLAGTLVLAFAVVLYAFSVGVHHLVLRGDHEWSDPGGATWTLPDQISFEVGSWLENTTEHNTRRRGALAGLWGWLLATCGIGLWAAIGRQPGSWTRGPRALLAIALALIGVFHLRQAPRAHALANWGLVYPRVHPQDVTCLGAGSRAALVPERCRALDVSAGARERLILLVGDGCEPPSPRLVPLRDSGAERCLLPSNGIEPVFGTR